MFTYSLSYFPPKTDLSNELKVILLPNTQTEAFFRTILKIENWVLNLMFFSVDAAWLESLGPSPNTSHSNIYFSHFLTYYAWVNLWFQDNSYNLDQRTSSPWNLWSGMKVHFKKLLVKETMKKVTIHKGRKIEKYLMSKSFPHWQKKKFKKQEKTNRKYPKIWFEADF